MKHCHICGDTYPPYHCDNCNKWFCKECYGFKTSSICYGCLTKVWDQKTAYKVTKDDLVDLGRIRHQLRELAKHANKFVPREYLNGIDMRINGIEKKLLKFEEKIKENKII